MDLETFLQLLTPAGRALLDEIADRAGVESDLGLGTRLRKSFPPDLVAAAVTQNHLRGKAAAKFGPLARELFFTHDALEQSTRSVVADHRAQRLAATGAVAVVDLGCGIGGDLLAFGRAGLQVRGIERDPVRAAIARANLAAARIEGTVEVADAESTRIADHEVAFIDPARRDARGRTFGTADLQPSWDWVRQRLTGRSLAKVMPGLAHGDVPAGVEAEWVSDGGDLVEAALWGEPFATTTRRASLLPAGVTLTTSGESAEVADVGAHLYEPDDAVLRAGLVAELASTIGGWLPDPHIAYVSTSIPVQTPFGRGFTVIEELPFREKTLKAALQARHVGTLTIKKRGVEIVPDQVIRRMKLKGPEKALVIMTRVRGAGRAYLVTPH